MADIELEDLGGAETETVPTVVIANPSLKTTDLRASQEIETMQQDEPRGTKDLGNEYAEAGDTEARDIESGNIEAVDMEAVDVESPPQDNEAAQSTNSRSGDHEKVLKNLLYLAVLIICALIAVVLYQHFTPCPVCSEQETATDPHGATTAASTSLDVTTKNDSLPLSFYDGNYLRYLAYKNTESKYLKKRQILWHADACDTELNRKPSDPLFFTSNQRIPLEPAVTGFMGQFGTYRFLSMFEMMAMFIGEEKHGMWRFQENGFIRVYRKNGSNVGILPEEKKRAIESGLHYVDADEYAREDRLLRILRNNYMNIDPALDFDYAFAKTDTSIIKNADGRSIEVLNWIDLPIYHEKFTRKYEDHVPIDTPAYFCQVSAGNFPQARLAWQLITAQEKANKVGPLGIRAGLDIKENFHKIIQLHQFPGATAWANIGQGDPETDVRPKNLEEMRERPQTVNYTAIDIGEGKVEIEIYLAERGYSNSTVTYLQFIVVLKDNKHPEAYTYLRPDGYYYDVLVKFNENAKHINQYPVSKFSISIRGEDEQKRVYSTVAFAMSNLNRPQFNLEGGGCPAKGGDITGYPWGNPGSGFETNYEEVLPLCDAILVDIRFWTNLGDPLNDPAVKLGNSGTGYNSTKIAEYVTNPNLYGRFTDPYNVKKGIKNNDTIDFTTDHKTLWGLDENNRENVTFRIDFGKRGTLNKVIIPEDLDITPIGCVADKKDQTGDHYCKALP